MRWNNELLDAMRKVGDPLADALVRETLEQSATEAGRVNGIGRLGYNAMLDLADRIAETPVLALARGSRLNADLADMPNSLRDYFDPMPAPAWVSAEKMAVGASLWDKNMLIMLAGLYAASLPACYLIARGIPALYKTGKLRKQRYIYQRIYETGLMLDAVLSRDGFTVVEDIETDTDERFHAALRAADPGGKWQRSGPRWVRTAGDVEVDAGQLRQHMAETLSGRKRFLWGKGYVATKKVRFLHASMRFMLTRAAQPATGDDDIDAKNLSEAIRRADAWDVDALGQPVNQEDLAFTLLTFGYCLPLALEKWGCPVTDKERDGFLHLWRVVGHVLGIDDALLTDDWQEAEALFELIAARQAGESEAGKALTETLLKFLGDYLPQHGNVSDRISASMIVDQLGTERAGMVLDRNLLASVERWPWRLAYGAARRALRVYYFSRTMIFSRSRTLRSVFGQLLDHASEELIESWRGAYARRPFYVPKSATSWTRDIGASDEFLAKLTRWRRHYFNNLAIAMALLIGAGLLFVVALLASVFEPTMLKPMMIVSLGATCFAAVFLKWRLPAVFARRPVLAGEPEVLTTHDA